MSSAPCRAQKLKISARHQARFLYVSTEHVLSVSACVASGATTTNTSQQAENAGKDVMIIAVGKKSRDQLARLYGDKLVRTFELSEHKTVGLPSAQPIAEMIATAFEDGQADVVTLFYSQFKSVIQQVPTAKQLIPAVVEGDAQPIDLNGAVYEYEPSEEEILETLLPRNLTTQILAALYENQAGFFGSQMAAMDNATRNAGDLINALTLQYNRKRQAQITTELIEIIAGAEAL